MAIEVASQSCLFFKFPELKRLTRGAREEGSYSSEDDDSEDDDNEDGNSEDGNSEDGNSEDGNSEDSEEDDSDDDSERDDSENDDLEDSDEIGIYHNYIHDLESLWWILVWTVFIYKKSTRRTDKTLEKRVKIQQRRYNNLFSGNMGFRSRSLYLRDYRVFERYMENVPPFFEGYARMIKYFRVLLLTEYDGVEKEVPAPVYLPGPGAIHKEFLKKLLKRKIHKGKVVSIFNQAPLKRSAEAQDDLQRPDSKRIKTIPKNTRLTGSIDPSPL